ncbi:MAG: LPXTG cell wall anchor domain-containing protein, partial [Clostridiales bacterium]|nr:LPXTG cell wall anchor domain-containing protein [Clostridiales bacterium]
DAEDEETGMAAMDISFYDGDGLEVEPTAPVSVSIDASALLPEEADAGTIEVQHLTETESGVEATLVADADNGVDTDAETVEFEVESFSTFTVTWKYGPGSGSTASFEVTVYIGTEEYTGSIANLSATLSMNGSESVDLSTLLTDYEFDHAEVTYSTSSSSNLTTSIATAISFTDGGNNGSYYTITTTDGTITNVTSISSVKVYYKANEPSVSISADGSDESGYTLTATSSNFSGTPTYSWSISNTDTATLSYDSDGNPVITWADDAEDEDTVTVTVKATYTYTDSDGNEQTEEAESTYTLTKGQVELTVYVTYNGDTAASGATVTLTDSDGNTVGTGTTDSKGKVTFSVANTVTYTITASYTVSSSTTLTGSETILVSGATTETIELTSSASTGSSVISSKSFNHIDVKFEGAESEGSEGYTLESVTSIYIYNDSNNLVYYSTEYSTDSSTGEWRFTFKDSSGNTVNNLTLDTTYTIVITYTVVDSDNKEHTYIATITSDSTYADGATYSTDGDNAYKLYNYLYGTSYSSNAELEMDGIYEVDIGGMSVFLVAAIVCNGSSVSGYNTLSSTDGLDFVLDLGTLLKYSANWDFEVEKTFKNSGMDAGQFTFILASAEVNTDDVWTVGKTLQTATNSAANMGSDGNSTDTISFTQINYSSSDTGTYYYIVYEQNGGTTSSDGITYSSAVYGVVVTVTTTTSTSGSTTTATTAVTATYYELVENEDGTGYVISGDAIDEWEWSSSDSTLISLAFTNSYEEPTAGITILKVDADNNSTTLSGAEFTLTTSTTDTESGNTTTTYYSADGKSSSEKITLTTDSDGEISITGLSTGTYTLTEVTAPDGYNLLTEEVTITVVNGSVTVSYDENSSYVSYDSSTMTITIKNKAGYVLPSTGGSGTWLYTLTGTVLCCGAALLLWKRRVTD